MRSACFLLALLVVVGGYSTATSLHKVLAQTNPSIKQPIDKTAPLRTPGPALPIITPAQPASPELKTPRATPDRQIPLPETKGPSTKIPQGSSTNPTVQTPAAISVPPPPSQSSTPGYVAPQAATTDEPMNPLTDLSQPALRGSAQINTVSGLAHALSKCPLTKCRDHKLKFVELKVINNSQQITFIDGDSTQAQVVGPNLRASSPAYLGKTAAKNLSLAEHLLIAGVSLPTCALAGPIFYEVLNSSQYSKRYLGRAIGFDGVRHEIEGERFGLRMIMPGDESTGWLAFKDPGKQQMKKLVVPVSFTTDRIPAGSLIIPIEKQ